MFFFKHLVKRLIPDSVSIYQCKLYCDKEVAYLKIRSKAWYCGKIDQVNFYFSTK